MNILKRRTLKITLFAAFLLTLTLGVIFALPARTASAEEFVPQNTVNVTTEQALKDAVSEAGATPTKIILDNDIELQVSEVSINQNQNIAIDLNGHTLSRNSWVIVNWWGNLYLQDSSPEKTGTIAAASNANFHALVYNYGKMVSSVNYEVKYQACVAVANELRLYEDMQYISSPSLTITGGTVMHEGNPNNGVTLLEVIDGDLTITGGTFITGGYQGTNSLLVDVSSTDLRPDYFPEWGTEYRESEAGGFELTPAGQEKVEAVLKEFQPKIEAYRPYRRSNVMIEGGDFTAFSAKCGVMKVALNVEEVTEFRCGQYSASWGTDVTGPYNATVAITGGKWGRDLSGYVGDGYWMEHIQETSQDGEIIEDFYQVAVADKDKAEASVTVDGKENFYTTVSAAFDAAKTTVAEQHVIKLLKNATVKIISLKDVSGDMVLDLNGHKLKVDPENQNSTHIDVSSSSNFKNRFIIRDTSAQQGGELELCASKGVSKQSFFYLYTGNTKVVLESGTIRQTGLLPESYKDYSTDDVTRSNNDKLLYMSLFKFAPTGLPNEYLDKYKNNFQNTVTIKGGNIISELSFGTADNIVATHEGVLVGFDGPNYNNDEFGLISKDGDNIPDKDKMISLDLEAYLADGTKACKFSWDFNDLVAGKGLTSNASGDGYIVSKVSADQYFIIGSSARKVDTLQAALDGAEDNDTISVIQDTTVADAITIGRGITLNLNAVVNFNLTFEKGFTLTDGASICYGNINAQGAVTIAGDATLENVTLNGDITVSGGTLSISSGIYNGEFTINGEGKMAISGGSFKGSQIATLDQYFDEYLGAFDENNGYDYETNSNELYSVKLGPNLAAQEWYKQFQDNVYEIASTAEWLYFSLYVNSGIDNFKGKTVQLTAELNFDPNAASGIALAAEAKASNFMPAGNKQHAFAGIFDGNNKTMSNIVAQEKAVGLFGYTTGESRFRNIILKDSTFMTGNGLLDEFNGTGYNAGGALIGEGFMGGNAEGTDWSGNITLNNVKVGYANDAQNFNGGIIGHSWGNVYIDGLNFRNKTTVSSNWKMGGVVGYLEGNFYIKKADIEEGTDERGNGLILDDDNAFFAAGALVGHANGSNNTIENCTILEPNDSLIGTTYAGGTGSTITIKGAQTDLDIYRVVGAGRDPEKSETIIEITGESTEEGVSKGSIKTKKDEDYLKFTDGNGKELIPEKNPEGGYDVKATVHVTVSVHDITGEITYAGETEVTITVTNFTLKDSYGNVYDWTGENLTLTVTLEKSKYNVGTEVALITSIALGGEDAENYTLAVRENQAFMDITVNRANLYVSIDETGRVSYDGFVGGEDESVLGGELVITYDENGAAHLSGLESSNYNIVYRDGTIVNRAGNDLTALWIVLGTVAAVVAVAAVAVAIKKRQK